MENNYKNILDLLPNAIYVIDRGFKIIYVNDLTCKILGKSKGNIIGNKCKYVCESDRCEIGCLISEVLNSGKQLEGIETVFFDKKSNPVKVKVNATPLIDDSKKIIGGIISFESEKDFSENEKLIKENSYMGIVSGSAKIKAIFKLINDIADSDAPVLITGETGVGKEMFADLVQKLSSRKSKKFVKLNCSAIPGNLIESELFGHAKGAFTGATSNRKGRFEVANEGTIFLDEIGELPPDTQPKLLRILQEGSFEPLGSSTTIKTDTRIIAATNKDLNTEIKNGNFRSDLFYRLNVIPIHIPPLRERQEDILLLTRYFITYFSKLYNKKIDRTDTETIDLFFNYDWPGNVRELRNVIEYSIIRSKRNDIIEFNSLPDSLKSSIEKKSFNNSKEKLSEKDQYLLKLLRHNNWNKSKVAEILGVNRSTIHRRLQKLNIL